MLKKTNGLLLLLLGHLMVVLAIIGAILPIMPTAPFVIIAAYCYSKGSPRLHHWLRTAPHLGPYLTHWEDSRSIPMLGKILASVGITVGFFSTLYFGAHMLWVKIIFPIVGISILIFIWTRPTATKLDK